MKIYGMTGSGNCYKPALLLNLLGRRYQWIEVDLIKGQTRTPEFLARNPNGKVPVLEVDGRFLAESNAMLCYLAEGTPFLPQDAWQRAQVLQWLFFEQYSHEPYIATVRFWIHYLRKETEWAQRIAEARPKGYAALDVMEQRLAQSDWLVDGCCTVADIALYAYTHVAHQGGYELGRYPGIQAWLRRVTQQPGFVNPEQASATCA